MDISTIENVFHEYAKDPLNLRNSRQLLAKLALYIIDKEKPKQPIPEEPYITLMEFYEKTHICHPSTLGDMLKNDNDFFILSGAIKHPNKYKIQMEKTLNYLKRCHSKPKLKQKTIEFLKERENKESNKCQTIQATLPLQPTR